MFTLHMDLTAKSGLGDALTSVYREVFCPAIGKQPGFSETKLLLAHSAGVQTHRLVIVFEREEFQKQWVASDLHQQVWTKMEPNIAKVACDFFDVVGSSSTVHNGTQS